MHCFIIESDHCEQVAEREEAEVVYHEHYAGFASAKHSQVGPSPLHLTEVGKESLVLLLPDFLGRCYKVHSIVAAGPKEVKRKRNHKIFEKSL